MLVSHTAIMNFNIVLILFRILFSFMLVHLLFLFIAFHLAIVRAFYYSELLALFMHTSMEGICKKYNYTPFYFNIKVKLIIRNCWKQRCMNKRRTFYI